MRFMRWGLVTLAFGLAGCAHAQAPDVEASREARHPIDHFTTHAAFRATLFARSAPAGEASWSPPGATVVLAELSCAVRETSKGRTAHCTAGSALPPAFRALLSEDEPAPAADFKARLAQCHAVTANTPSTAVLAAYEAVLRADPTALPPVIDDAYVIAYVGHDEAPFVGRCKPEPDGSCLYVAEESRDEATVEARISLGGARVKSAPYTPSMRVLRLSFVDGQAPPPLAGVRVESAERHDSTDPATLAWSPIIEFYRKKPSPRRLRRGPRSGRAHRGVRARADREVDAPRQGHLAE